MSYVLGLESIAEQVVLDRATKRTAAESPLGAAKVFLQGSGEPKARPDDHWPEEDVEAE